MTLATSHILVGGSCLVAGVGVGYFVAVKKAEAKYRQFAEDEIAAVKRSYRLLRKEGEFENPETAFKEYAERVDELHYGWEQQARLLDEAEARESDAIQQANESAEASETSDVPEDEPKPETGAISVAAAIVETALGQEGVTVMNIFNQAQPSDDEIGQPLDADMPYVITEEEYNVDEPDYEKYTITWYDGDNTLADDRDTVIYDIEGTIGLKSLTEFKGTTVIYVRNPKIQVDYEVCMSPGTYVSEVLGLDPDEPSPR